MTPEIRKLAEEVRAAADPDVVSIDINIDETGIRVDEFTRDPDSLKRSGVSMRNVRGEWIK